MQDLIYVESFHFVGNGRVAMGVRVPTSFNFSPPATQSPGS